MSYKDIIFQDASVLWGTRMAERNAEKERKSEKAKLLMYMNTSSCCELKQKQETAFVNRLRGKNLKQ